MKRIGVMTMVVAATLALTLAVQLPGRAQDVPRITKEELQARMNQPDVLIVDVRTEADWKESDQKIQKAVREDPTAVSSWMNKYPKDKTIVLYCA